MENAQSVALFIIGMAGSGKSTLVQVIYSYKQLQKNNNNLAINLDPAVLNIDFPTLFDIRNLYHYKHVFFNHQVMKTYDLGPNGAIMTALNLLGCDPKPLIDKVMEAEQSQKNKYCYIVDVPGQIQSFIWSASSIIFTNYFATLMPVLLIFVIDVFKCQNPNSFLSNLLFASSFVLQESIETRLGFPMVLALNKCDILDPSNNVEWLKDQNSFTKVLNQSDTYLSTLSRSVVLYMSEMFELMPYCKISAKNGFGLEQFWERVTKGVEQFKKKQQKNRQKETNQSIVQLRKKVSQLQILQKKQKQMGVNLSVYKTD